MLTIAVKRTRIFSWVSACLFVSVSTESASRRNVALNSSIVFFLEQRENFHIGHVVRRLPRVRLLRASVFQARLGRLILDYMEDMLLFDNT